MGTIRDPAKNPVITFKVKEMDRETGQEIPYRNYDRRSFAPPVMEPIG